MRSTRRPGQIPGLANAAGQAQGQGESKRIGRSPGETEGPVEDSLNQGAFGRLFLSKSWTAEDAEDAEEKQEGGRATWIGNGAGWPEYPLDFRFGKRSQHFRHQLPTTFSLFVFFRVLKGYSDVLRT